MEAKFSSIIEELENIFKNCIIGFKEIGGGLLTEVKAECLPEVASYVFNNLRMYYSTSSGSDERSIDGKFAVYHVFSADGIGFFVLKASVPATKPCIPSITSKVPGANWAEREAMDMFGITFINHPEPKRLVLPDDWPKNLHPLRKDFEYSYRPSSEPTISTSIDIYVGGTEYASTLPLGPYHPALHEPEYFELLIKGEEVIDVKYRGFHVHRGIEKIGESKLTYNQVPFIAERICGICGFAHSSSYCIAIERALKIDVPERAQYIRSLILEIERIHSHLLWVGVACHLLGFETGFMQSWRIREHVMELAELLTGSRKTYGINIPGGVRRDILEPYIDRAKKVIKLVEDEFKVLRDKLLVPEVKVRLKEIGYLPKEDARKLAVLGPTMRGSGIARDVRKDQPYCAYRDLDFRIAVYDEGDNLSRTLVRIDEILESINIVKQILDNLPSGPIRTEFEPKPYRIGVGAAEAPRGEVFHLLITGERNRLYRWRVRAPTYNNIPALKIMLRGVPLADAPITIASIDPCFSCTDRCILIKDLDHNYVKRTSLLSFRKFIKGD